MRKEDKDRWEYIDHWEYRNNPNHNARPADNGEKTVRELIEANLGRHAEQIITYSTGNQILAIGLPMVKGEEETEHMKKPLRDKKRLVGGPYIKDVRFNGPATIVFWSDDTKTIVKCTDGDEYDREKGLAMAICKKAFGTNYHKIFEICELES